MAMETTGGPPHRKEPVMRNLRRAAAAAVLALALVPCANAREAAPKTALQARHAQPDISLLGNLWSFLGRLWTAQPSPAASRAVCVAGDEGCGLDPWGGIQTQTVDEGCGIDPWGRCVTGH
jgi:hypothetical protein